MLVEGALIWCTSLGRRKRASVACDQHAGSPIRRGSNELWKGSAFNPTLAARRWGTGDQRSGISPTAQGIHPF